MHTPRALANTSRTTASAAAPLQHNDAKTTQLEARAVEKMHPYPIAEIDGRARRDGAVEEEKKRLVSCRKGSIFSSGHGICPDIKSGYTLPDVDASVPTYCDGMMVCNCEHQSSTGKTDAGREAPKMSITASFPRLGPGPSFLWEFRPTIRFWNLHEL